MPPTLFILIFGESALNDGLAVVLYDVLIGYVSPEGGEASEPPQPSDLWNVIQSVALSLVLSVGIGILCGVSPGGTLFCLFVCSFVRLFVCSFVRLFVCSFVGMWHSRLTRAPPASPCVP